MKPLVFLTLLFLAFLPVLGQEARLKMRIYLIGDAGEIEKGHHPVVEKLRTKLSKNPEVPTHLIYLGDNIYPFGLPPKKDENRVEAENILNTQLDIWSDLPGKIWMIPGNHD